MSASLELIAVDGLPEIASGDALGAMIDEHIELADGDVVTVAQKIVSKAEGRHASLAGIEPSERAVQLAGRLDKEPALVELILRESRRVVREERVLIVETHGGLVCANAGIDSSNVGPGGDVLLLPLDPDASARALRAELREASGRNVAVIVTDSFGRPWRVGQSEVAIGCAGIGPIDDRRGEPDRDGRELAATEIAIVDELAAAADLARKKASGQPVVVVRGRGDLVTEEDGPGAVAMIRAADDDLFR
jgi:coenzyme F420-0:L-glutamate ligase/coenzyme F420-1:gamma-L-glutamate ligase